MAPDIARFFARWERLPWCWGTVDCCTVLAAWAVEKGHSDLLEPFRGRYDTQVSCEAIIERHGSLVSLIAEQASRIGLSTCAVRVPGVIAVIGSPKRGLRQWGAIYDGTCWQVRSSEGFTPMVAPVLGMWSV